MAELYRHFGRDWQHVLDFSDQMLIEHFNHVSYGTSISKNNGFFVGAKWMNVVVSMWLEDKVKGHLVQEELYSDPNYPHWWLDNILGN